MHNLFLHSIHYRTSRLSVVVFGNVIFILHLFLVCVLFQWKQRSTSVDFLLQFSIDSFHHSCHPLLHQVLFLLYWCVPAFPVGMRSFWCRAAYFTAVATDCCFELLNRFLVEWHRRSHCSPPTWKLWTIRAGGWLTVTCCCDKVELFFLSDFSLKSIEEKKTHWK